MAKLAVPSQKVMAENELPEKLYVTFTEDEHKRTLKRVFPNYTNTAIASEMGEYWLNYIEEIKSAIARGDESVDFDLTE